jgi:hypothetical protein
MNCISVRSTVAITCKPASYSKLQPDPVLHKCARCGQPLLFSGSRPSRPSKPRMLQRQDHILDLSSGSCPSCPSKPHTVTRQGHILCKKQSMQASIMQHAVALRVHFQASSTQVHRRSSHKARAVVSHNLIPTCHQGHAPAAPASRVCWQVPPAQPRGDPAVLLLAAAWLGRVHCNIDAIQPRHASKHHAASRRSKHAS